MLGGLSSFGGYFVQSVHLVCPLSGGLSSFGGYFVHLVCPLLGGLSSFGVSFIRGFTTFTSKDWGKVLIREVLIREIPLYIGVPIKYTSQLVE